MDLLNEIWESLRRNKLRTCLSGFSVAWGIFMIIVLLGAGNGLMNAFSENSHDVLVNTMDVYGGVTSVPYDGLKRGRWTFLDTADVSLTRGPAFADVIDDVTAVQKQGEAIASFGRQHMSVSILGVFPEYAVMNKVKMVAGRFVDQIDVRDKTKNIVIAMSHVKTLTGGGEDYESLIGKYIRIDGIQCKVTGIYQSNENSQWDSFYMPFSTMNIVFGKGKYLSNLIFSFHGLKTEKDNKEFEDRYRSHLNLHHRASPTDRSALWIANRYTQNMQMENAMGILQTALWIIGILTLLSGIVGVSNIMLITVKERTREFGIRKAIGASPYQVIRLILAESVTITAVFGYVGMILGLVACEVLGATVGKSSMEVLGQSIHMISNPSVGVDVALEATLLLIVAGTIAGLIPATKASRVRPIEALRAD